MKTEIKLISYDRKYLDDLIMIFQSAIRMSCSKDYSDEQLNAWLSNIDKIRWHKMYSKHYTLIATIDKNLVGFGDITDNGYLNMLYVHPDFQKKGVATFICDSLESHVNSDIYVDASITAKPFFLNRNYQVIQKQTVYRNGIPLTNFKMIKHKC